MSQETRRRLAARAALTPQPQRESDLPAELRIGRFSEGIEQPRTGCRIVRLGRFSDGAERLPPEAGDKRLVGSFSRGHEQRPRDPDRETLVGSFARGYRSDPD
jgi:hypothetical protein